jgi:ribA/ribD-fused uncharacterized protein
MRTEEERPILFYLKDEQYGWLSNFWPSQVVGEDGIVYPTSEHYYQAHKTNDQRIRRWIADAPKPYLAMKAGRNLREKDGVPADWETYKVQVMANALHLKFKQNPGLARKLLSTGDALLGEDSPTDMFWGVKGKNQLGNLLAKVREELRVLNDKDGEPR